MPFRISLLFYVSPWASVALDFPPYVSAWASVIWPCDSVLSARTSHFPRPWVLAQDGQFKPLRSIKTFTGNSVKGSHFCH